MCRLWVLGGGGGCDINCFTLLFLFSVFVLFFCFLFSLRKILNWERYQRQIPFSLLTFLTDDVPFRRRRSLGGSSVPAIERSNLAN